MKLPKFKIGEIVYAIAFMNDSVDNKNQSDKVDEWDRDFAKIFKVSIEGIYINKSSIDYVLKDINDNQDWGIEVIEEHISRNPNELFKYLYNRWLLNR